MIVAKGLSVEGVYAGVSFEAGAGTLTAVAGPAGSGRTSLLLTLAGRMKPTAGTLAVAGHVKPRAIRKVAALALLDGVTDLDRSLTVGEHLRERGRGPYPKLLKQAGLDAGERTLVRELDREGQVRLGVALALIDDPKVIVADNVDAGLPPDRQEALWTLLAGLDRAVVASCVTPPARYDHLVEL
ncbi:ATP-binding cassette domain-containing protein [Nonomuraea roseoviolacea subsp. roseoviolacea]|uniref:ABC-type multidrug transport system ATPase subunit n=1 Tax=Nonomuraea roseoviolacea subsp. carminata TaxID=160689 RepID=A0ABT1K771_9ACTN|nr:ATP-binding cassette domain-containing protein [Nonomuraea roseoviolacea]MCP2349447.1 ABC-type multidrug transport system ATPase subunit [Nonomuraea roseoviolacea subsp. carminata]